MWLGKTSQHPPRIEAPSSLHFSAKEIKFSSLKFLFTPKESIGLLPGLIFQPSGILANAFTLKPKGMPNL